MNRVPLLRHARRMAARAASVCAEPASAPRVSAVERLECRVLLATFTVTTTADSGPGSLREAITLANTAAGADTIAFNVPGAGVATITPLTPLPAVTGALNLDASTQPGYAGAPLIELNGSVARDRSAPGGVASGLVINAGPSLVRGMAVNRFGGDGIVLGAGATNSRVEACYVGTNAAGTEAAGNGGAGIHVAADRAVIGGGGAERRNVVSGNDLGILFDATFQGVGLGLVSGNFVGTDAAGLHAVGNRTYGIEATTTLAVTVGGPNLAARNIISGNGASGVYGGVVVGNFIGTDVAGGTAVPNGTDPNAPYRDGVTLAGRITGNLISGNRGNGITLNGASAIAGNYVGTDATGRRALGNDGNGIIVTGNFNGTIGAAGPTSAPPEIDPAGAGRNVISGNGGNGVLIAVGDGRVKYNYIGVSADGTLPLGNRGSGVYCTGTVTNVGGTAAGEGNVISANGGDGVTSFRSGNILGNHIGTNAAGDASTPGFGNAGNGVLLLGGGTVVNNTATGGGTVSNNTIGFNGANGILVQGSAAAGAKATISHNSIFSNGKLGIDLATPFQGVSDVHPLILSAVSDGGQNLVRYKGLGTVEFFASPDPDPSGFGEGKTFLAAKLSDGTEQTVRLPGLAPGMFVTATSTVANATSEFSNAVAVAAGVVEPSASVVGRYLFYNQSYFDSGSAAANPQDDNAIDPTKRALLPGESATFANVSSYTRGLNGVMFDLKDMPLGNQPPNVVVKVGVPGAGPGDPVTWTEGPRPTVVARRNGAGPGQTDRITLIWPNGSIKNQWLQVTVKADAASLLPRDDVFYVGNLVGETGDAASPLWVSAIDYSATRRATQAFPGPVGVREVYDIDRNGSLAGTADAALVRSNLFHRLPALTAPPATPAPVITASPLRRKRPSEDVGLLG